MSTKNAVRRTKFRRIGEELTGSELEWMARKGELLKPRPIPVEDDECSSTLYGPQMRTVQLERVELIMLDSRDGYEAEYGSKN